MVRFFIVDDHPLFVHGLADRLRAQGELEFAGSAGDGAAAKRLLLNASLDVVLLDLCLPDISGVELSYWVRDRLPKVPALWMSNYVSEDYIDLARAIGVKGFIAKSNDSESFAAAIRRAANGHETWLMPKRKIGAGARDSDAMPPAADLTMRQRQVAGLVAAGLLNKEIAERLHITKRTVDTHRTVIYRKLHLHGTAELTRYCMEHLQLEKS
jgi:DNA-binding NarL/FixJ family response regulator